MSEIKALYKLPNACESKRANPASNDGLGSEEIPMSKRPGNLHARFPSALRHFCSVVFVAAGSSTCFAEAAGQAPSDTQIRRKLNSSAGASVNEDSAALSDS